MGLVVVKVGGSLYAHPGLGPGLRAYLQAFAPSSVLIVPGGGDFTDAVRKLDSIHGLGEELAHDLALASLRPAADFLRGLLPGAAEWGGPDPADLWTPGPIRILDAQAFCRGQPDLPHTWQVTSDSIAARAAVVSGAARLVLLKSVDIPPGTAWPEAAAKGYVDHHFPLEAARLRIPVDAFNFRGWLEHRGRDRQGPP